MPDPDAPPASSNGDQQPPPFQLDVTRLHSLPSEQQSLYVLPFTADLLRHVQGLDDDAASQQQAPLRKELLQLITLASPAPARVVRNNIGRCFAGIFGRSNRKLLYESINELVAIVQAGKERDLRCKHAAAASLGALFEAAGDSAMSLSPLACTALLKAVKAASSDTGYRGALFKAMGKIAVGIKTALDEDMARSMWKVARTTASGDKSLLVQASACNCLQQLVRSTPYFDNSNDFEKLQTALWKCMESSSASVRHAAASCLTLVLFKSYMSYTESPNTAAVPRVKKPRAKKKAAKGEEPEDEIDRTASPAPEKPATALSYSLLDVLRVLSTHYCRTTTTNKARAGVAVCYMKLIKALGESVIEKNYGDVARHFFNDILSHSSMQYNRYRQLMSRKFVRIILERVIGAMLGETAQLNACRYLLNEIIKDYPQAIKERPEPSKQTLTGAISALTSMIGYLDAAVNTIAEQVREGLLQVLQHPNFTVQIHTARALRAFVLACPQQLLPTVTICMNSVSRELTLLAGPRQAPKRCVGYAHGLAAVLSTSSHHPLYGSVDVYARVLQQATTLLKTSGSSDLRISSCQLQVAWIMIGGLMSLGPNFVKIHLSQLMLLWRNALPKPVPKENMSQRNMIELSYLAHVRECALGSIKAFLTFNQRLLTIDVSRRLSAMLENTVTFIQALPEKKTSDDPANRLSPALQLQDYEIMVRRRVFQCFSQLLTLTPLGSIESTAHSTILPLAVASFSDAEYYSPSSLSAAIASAAAAFESIWDVGDNNGFGLTGLIHGREVIDPVTRKVHKHWSSRQEDEADIDRVVLSPVGDAPEHDPTCCYLPDDSSLEEPNPPGTEAVNAAIAAFGLCLPLQAPRVQESALEQITSSLGSASLQKDPARRAAIAVNVALALNAVCNVSIGESGSAKGDLKRDATENALVDLLHTCIKDPEECVRQLAADALGALCCSSGNLWTTNEITWLTETIVKNREPHVRAGCALTLASIHSQLGGMAAGYHMKQIVGILMSLAADTHPLVHCWALDALARVAESAGLGYSAYVTTTIGMLSQLYVSDSHTSETAVLASSNMSLELPVTAAIARGVDSIINVLGPDLQDTTKARDMILTLVRLILEEANVGVRLEGLRCMEHLSLYAPGHLEFAKYVRYLQRDVSSDEAEMSQAALHGLSVLMRRDATEIVRTAHPGLEDKLWDCLNSSPHQQDVLNIFRNWLTQTGSIDPAEWIQRCNTVLTKSKSKIEAPKTAHTKSAVTAGPEVQDEEVAGFAVAGGATREDDAQAPTSTQELMRWQVRLFAMELLQELIAVISKEAAVSDDSPGEAALQSKVADVVRIAFSASTAGVAALRVVGMRIIDQILKLFGRTPDPDFPEAMLLEQYQAQISSALTPAFAADSSPELAAAAVSVCATFIATGIVTDIDRMGRILKVLVSALDSFSKDAESASIGDLKALSSNALVMVRMAVFSAWAKLQIASAEQSYLVEVVKPHIAQLVPLWLSSLREFSRLRFEPDISASMGTPVAGDLDMVYAALNRETLLTFYQDSWLSLVDAIASLIDEDSEFVFDALDNKHASTTGAGEGESESSQPNGVNGVPRKNTGINYREEPVAFFFVLFGLAFESLAVRNADDSVVTTQRNTDILQALKKILRPSVSGNAVYQEVVFSETIDLLSRMVLTESLGVQALVVEIARNLCIVHPSSRQGLQTPVNGEALSDDIEQLFELTRIIVLVLGNLIPGLADSPAASSARLESSEETISLVRTSLQALVDVSDVFPSIIKTDLDASTLHVFVTILGTAACQASVVPQSLPIFRRFIVSIADNNTREETSAQLRNALSRMLLILKNAQKRETDASLPCERNCLLAITVLLSAAPQIFAPSDPLLSRFITELNDSLSGPKTSRVAAGCLRTLLLANISPSTLLTHAITFTLTPATLEGVTETRPLMAQTLTTFAAKLAGGSNRDPHAATVALVLHVLLDRAAKEGEGVYAETSARLLELAALGSGEGTVFRSVVGAMGAEQKALMERVLRRGAGRRGGGGEKWDAVGGEREPRIALRLDFG
ncbi:ARM repeat-containing protein [Teratosphaeria nubilosa]|uniref:ARM repeat-containing protein n=1 Tax=Teratosphaeria nubilosa TaxID=161662 RepID=A0A6G1LFG2_9PEZI|nr:ARM repeat-containing protein [Teratosphaeria nubilosa]